MNIEELRGLYIPQNYISKVEVNQLQAAVPVRTPAKEWFVRTHPDPEYWAPPVDLLKRFDGYYLVHKAAYKAVAQQGTLLRARLVASVTKQGLVFLWVINQRGTWGESAMRVAKAAQTNWVQVQTAKGFKGYTAVVPEDQGDEPRWTSEPFEVLVERAFRGRIIQSGTDLQSLNGVGGQ